MKFSRKEVKELWIAGLIISLAFAILLAGGYNALFSFNLSILVVFFIAFFTAGMGFLLHELMHKYVAQKYGLFAEFRAYYLGLFMALIFSLFGFILAAPGAVIIHGFITREKNGKISLAGPTTNIVLASIFLILVIFTAENNLLKAFLSYGLSINSLLALFNMLPVMPFDGSKIFAWNKKIYLLTILVALILFIISFIV